MARFCLIAFALLVFACSAHPTALVSPTPQVIKIIYPPALIPYSQVINDCATASPSVAIFQNESPKPEEKYPVVDLVLILGSPPKELDNYFAIGVSMEEIVLIVNSENKTKSITREELRDLFSGRVSEWETDNASHNSVQIWVYPSGDTIREVFNTAILGKGMISPQARIAPDPRAMLEAVAAYRGAIGYVPESWIAEKDTDRAAGIRSLQLDSDMAEALQQPVLALTKTEPQGALRSLLSCLQTRGE